MKTLRARSGLLTLSQRNPTNFGWIYVETTLKDLTVAAVNILTNIQGCI